LDRARSVGASKVATGHYAILERDPKTGRTLLRAAADPDKDQSYFLFDLSDEQRAVAHLPLGRMTKPEVRDIARAAGLLTAGEARVDGPVLRVEGGELPRGARARGLSLRGHGRGDRPPQR
jgi:tRNA-specific 2-thiouridylase